MRPTDANFRAALEAHGGRVERHLRGEISGPEFVPIRLSYGL